MDDSVHPLFHLEMLGKYEYHVYFLLWKPCSYMDGSHGIYIPVELQCHLKFSNSGFQGYYTFRLQPKCEVSYIVKELDDSFLCLDVNFDITSSLLLLYFWYALCIKMAFFPLYTIINGLNLLFPFIK